MGLPVELVGEQRLHFLAAVMAGRQADGVDDEQIDAGAWGPGAKVGRIQPLSASVPAVVPKAGGFSGMVGHGWARALRSGVGHESSALSAQQAGPGLSHGVAVLCSCAVLGAAVQAFFTRDGFVLRQMDAAMQADRHVGGRGRGWWLFFGSV